MSRSEDLIIIRAEVSGLNETARETLGRAAGWPSEELAVVIQQWRRQAYELRITSEQVRGGGCGCSMCQFGRQLDAVGLLADQYEGL